MSSSSLRLEVFAGLDVGDWRGRPMDKPTIPAWNGSVLKALRESRGWSAPELARAVGANKSQIYKWEDSENVPGADYLAAFLVLFGVGPMSFFTGVDGYQQFVVRHETGAVAEKMDDKLTEMINSPLPGRRMRALLSAGRHGKAGAARSRGARGQEEPTRPLPADPARNRGRES